jgi:hypothetical protein
VWVGSFSAFYVFYAYPPRFLSGGYGWRAIPEKKKPILSRGQGAGHTSRKKGKLGFSFLFRISGQLFKEAFGRS